MPAVREPSGDKAQALDVVEVRPGVRLKLNATDKAAFLASQTAEAETRRQWNLVNAGVTDKPAAVDAAPADDTDVADATPKGRAKAKA